MRLIDADALCEKWLCLIGDFKASDFVYAIDIAPTIEAKPIQHGRWLHRVYREYNSITSHTSLSIAFYKCSVCGHCSGADIDNYCPHCGAKMDKDWEEPEINPCRGCADYDGQGGCKSNGGCGAKMDEVEEDNGGI